MSMTLPCPLAYRLLHMENPILCWLLLLPLKRKSQLHSKQPPLQPLLQQLHLLRKSKNLLLVKKAHLGGLFLCPMQNAPSLPSPAGKKIIEQ